MGSGRIRSKPDLFSATSDQNPLSSTGSNTPPIVRHVLPTDLPNAIKQLDDQELKRLLAAVLTEQKRRGVKTRAIIEPSRRQRVDAVGVSLTTSKLNAVRAAFKAGIKPTQIARQFGLSDADVRKALASEEKKR
jgi:hypothetical protein